MLILINILLFIGIQALPYDYVVTSIHPNSGENNEDLLVYVTEPGEEYFMHMFLWRVIPFSFKLGADIEAIDLTVKKTQTTKDIKCDDNDNYDYIGIHSF